MQNKISRWCLLTMAFLTPLFFLPFSFEVFNFNKLYLLFVLTAVGLLAWLGEMIFKDKKIVLRKNIFNLPVIIFLAIISIGFFFSKDRATSLWGPYGSFWPSLFGLFLMAGVYMLIGNAKDKTKQILNWFMAGGFVALLSGLLSIFGVFNWISGLLLKIHPRLGLPFTMLGRNFNTVAGSLEGLAVFTAFLIFLSLLSLLNRSKNESNKNNYLLYPIIILGIVFLAILDIYFVWLLLALGLMLFLGFALWKRLFKDDVNSLGLPIFCFLIALLFLFFNPLAGFLSKIDSLANLPSEVLLRQTPSWKIAFSGVKESPIFGSGLGNFSYVFSKHKPSSFLQNNPLWYLRLDKPGNFMSQLLAETGILGFLSYLMILVVLLLGFFKFIRKKSDELKENGLLLSLVFAFLFLFLCQFLYYQNVVLAFSFWLMLGLVGADLARVNKSEKEEKAFVFKKYPEVGLVFSIIFWVLVMAIAFLSFILVQQYIADASYRSYLLNPQNNIAKLEKAARFGESRSIYDIILSRAYLASFIEEAQADNPNLEKIETLVALSINTAKKAVDKNPNNVLVLENAALVYREIQGVVQGAEAWTQKTLEQALLLEPKNPSLITEIGKLKVAEDKDGAIALFEEALAIKPDFSEAVLQLALIDEQNNNIDNAIKRLTDLISTSPYEVEARFHLGRLYYNKDQTEKAKEQFVVVLQLYPNHSNSLYSLALILEKEGDKTNALQLMQRVLELNPNNADIKVKIKSLSQ